MWTVQAGLLLRCGMSGRWGPALVWRLGLRSLSWLLVPELPTAFRAGVHEPPKVSGAGDRQTRLQLHAALGVAGDQAKGHSLHQGHHQPSLGDGREVGSSDSPAAGRTPLGC